MTLIGPFIFSTPSIAPTDHNRAHPLAFGALTGGIQAAYATSRSSAIERVDKGERGAKTMTPSASPTERPPMVKAVIPIHQRPLYQSHRQQRPGKPQKAGIRQNTPYPSCEGFTKKGQMSTVFCSR